LVSFPREYLESPGVEHRARCRTLEIYLYTHTLARDDARPGREHLAVPHVLAGADWAPVIFCVKIKLIPPVSAHHLVVALYSLSIIRVRAGGACLEPRGELWLRAGKTELIQDERGHSPQRTRRLRDEHLLQKPHLKLAFVRVVCDRQIQKLPTDTQPNMIWPLIAFAPPCLRIRSIQGAQEKLTELARSDRHWLFDHGLQPRHEYDGLVDSMRTFRRYPVAEGRLYPASSEATSSSTDERSRARISAALSGPSVANVFT
jgi:hypothetical protein